MLKFDKDGPYVNKKIEKEWLYDQYMLLHPQDKKWINQSKFKEKIKKFAFYSKLEFNPTTKGVRIKSNGHEYFILANDDFNANEIKVLKYATV